MLWIYRLQQRLALTRSESSALLAVSFILIAGLLAQRFGANEWPVDAATYAEEDRRFAEASAAPAADSAAPSVVIGPAHPDSPGTISGDTAGRIDLNAATAAELERLPRIGPAMAARILEHRAALGRFGSVADLRAVRGIGASTLARIEPYVFVEPAGAPPRTGASPR